MSDSSPWGDQPTQFFYELTPEKILDALEDSLGVRCTGAPSLTTVWRTGSTN